MPIFAGVMELADVTDSKSVGLIPRAGSTPAAGTMQKASLACMVYGSGALSMKGINVNKDGCGLRPAIWIHVE